MIGRSLFMTVLVAVGLAGCITGPPGAAAGPECAVYLAALDAINPANGRPTLSTVAIAGGRLEPDGGAEWLTGRTLHWPMGRVDMTACPGFQARAAALKIKLVAPRPTDLANPDVAGDASRPGSFDWFSRPVFDADGRTVWLIYGSGHWYGAILKGVRGPGGWVFGKDQGGWVTTDS